MDEDLIPRCDVERAGCVWKDETLVDKSVSEEERRLA